MSPSERITEDDLHAFVDGAIDTETGAEVEAWLAAHPEDAVRVRDWQRQKTQLHDAFDAVLDEPVPPAIEAALTAPPRRARSGIWTRAAAAVVLFTAGLGAGWVLHDEVGRRDAESFMHQAVSAHVVYVGERRHAVEVWAKEERHLVAWLSKRLKHPIKAPQLGELGFRLVGGRLVADAGTPAAQFMYEDSAGRRITLYTRRTRDGGDTSFRFVERGGVSAFYWIGGPLTFALMGEMKREELLPVARLVYRNLKS